MTRPPQFRTGRTRSAPADFPPTSGSRCGHSDAPAAGWSRRDQQFRRPPLRRRPTDGRIAARRRRHGNSHRCRGGRPPDRRVTASGQATRAGGGGWFIRCLHPAGFLRHPGHHRRHHPVEPLQTARHPTRSSSCPTWTATHPGGRPRQARARGATSIDDNVANAAAAGACSSRWGVRCASATWRSRRTKVERKVVRCRRGPDEAGAGAGPSLVLHLHLRNLSRD